MRFVSEKMRITHDEILNKAGKEIRTLDLSITNALLYQLSYPGKITVLRASDFSICISMVIIVAETAKPHKSLKKSCKHKLKLLI